MWTYSLIWMKRNVAPSRNVVRIPALSPKRLPDLSDSCAQCIVNDDESRIAVLTPAISFGSSVPSAGQCVAVHDPDEEVGREEGPEDHDLGDDEKQHPEQLGLDARGAVGLRRPVVVVVVDVRVGDRGGFHQAAASSLATRCARPACRCLARCCSTRPSATHCGAVLGQRRDHDLGDVEVLQGVHRRRVGIRVADHARGHDLVGAQRLEQLAPAARAPRARRGRRPSPAARPR